MKRMYHKHGLTKTAEHRAWRAIRQRCYNPKLPIYPNYGGRGISVCDRWMKSFLDFLSDMGPKPSPSHSIERIDNNGNYTPENCRWATKAEQSANQRSNIKVDWAGERLTATEWGRKLGFGPGIVLGRIKLGWSVERAMTTPTRKRINENV